MKITFKALALVATFLVPQVALAAAGGHDPVPGIDIIIKSANFEAPLSERDLKAVNALKGMEKPALIGKIAAGYVGKAIEGAPKGGWGPVLSKGMIAEWCLECRGGDVVIKAMPAEGKEPIVIIISIAE